MWLLNPRAIGILNGITVLVNVSYGYRVYASFIEPEDHLVSKTYMTRVEGENTRLRHYLARLHRKTLRYSKSIEYLKFKTVPAIA